MNKATGIFLSISVFVLFICVGLIAFFGLPGRAAFSGPILSAKSGADSPDASDAGTFVTDTSAVFWGGAKEDDELHVVVTVKGEVVLDELLSSKVEKRIDTADGYNVISINNGSVCVTEADCKNNICVNTGFISKKGQTIACIPHGMLVTIVSGGGE